MTEIKNPYLDSRLKRGLDIGIAMAALPAYVVGLGACALVDTENPTVVHERAKTDGQVFEIRKLNAKLFKRLGKFIVRSGFDEVPQVTSILGGTMSIVGPRAILPEDYDTFLSKLPHTLLQAWQDIMPGIKPGVISTYSLAEHASLDSKHRAIMDIYDVTNASFKHDLHLISRLGRAPNTPSLISLDSEQEVPAIEETENASSLDSQEIFESEFEIGEDVA